MTEYTLLLRDKQGNPFGARHTCTSIVEGCTVLGEFPDENGIPTKLEGTVIEILEINNLGVI